jgi:serine/threonine protein phosphatase PrpC
MGYSYTREAGLFLLADGMGGHADGEVAAQMALQSIAARFQREATPALADVKGFLEASLLSAHHQILRYARTRYQSDTPHHAGGGRGAAGPGLLVHCGDSRLYCARAGCSSARATIPLPKWPAAGPCCPAMRCRTATCCSPAWARPSARCSIWRPHRLLPGDRLLLCSDGLWDALPDAALLHGLCTAPLDAAVPALVDAALQAAGAHSDNVTALAVEWQPGMELPGGVAAPAGSFGLRAPKLPGG